MALLVPVFTADHARVDKGLESPKVKARAAGSARISVMIKAVGGLRACLFAWGIKAAGSSGFGGGITVAESATDKGFTLSGVHVPPLANVRYAFASVSRLVSAPPSARPYP